MVEGSKRKSNYNEQLAGVFGEANMRDHDIEMTTADRLVEWLAELTRTDGTLILKGADVSDVQAVWSALSKRCETSAYLAKELAALLREDGEQFDEPDAIATADIRTISKALAELTDDD